MSQPRAAFPLNDETWQELESLIDELARIAKSDTSARDFHAALLERAVAALAAVAGAVWTRRPEGGLRQEYQINFAVAGLESSHKSQMHDRIVQSVFEHRQPRGVPHSSGEGGGQGLGNPTPYALLLSPVVKEEVVVAVLEILQPPGVSPHTQNKALQLLSVLGELAAEFYTCSELRELRRREATRGQFEQFVQRIHTSLDFDATACAIANDGRQFIGCDRVSVLTTRGGKCRIAAISGIDVVDRRATIIRSLEYLASIAARTAEEIRYPEDLASAAPPLQSALERYVDAAHARRLTIVPLRISAVERNRDSNHEWEQEQGFHSVCGVIAAEDYDAEQNTEVRERRMHDVCRHAATALHNAVEHQRVPMMPLWRALTKLGWFVQLRQLPNTALLLVGAICLLVVGFLPAELKIAGQGELQPAERRDVFAPNDGVVDSLLVDHATRVKQGDVLVALSNSQLDFELSRVLGELQTAQQQRRANRALRLRAADGSAAREQQNQLAADEERLKELIASLGQQQQILQKQQAELRVRSPIDGQVVTWNASQLLENRPVTRGQILLTVADTAGPWVLEMHVDDDDMGHVLDARQKLRPDLQVSFLLATNPGITHQGRVENVSMRTELREERKPAVRVTVSVQRGEFASLRPGASVVARIHCGRRALAYVWLHDLFDAIRSRLLF